MQPQVACLMNISLSPGLYFSGVLEYFRFLHSSFVAVPFRKRMKTGNFQYIFWKTLEGESRAMTHAKGAHLSDSCLKSSELNFNGGANAIFTSFLAAG